MTQKDRSSMSVGLTLTLPWYSDGLVALGAWKRSPHPPAPTATFLSLPEFYLQSFKDTKRKQLNVREREAHQGWLIQASGLRLYRICRSSCLTLL